MSGQRVRLGNDFELDIESGELHRLAAVSEEAVSEEAAPGAEATVRLQPQPAEVLALLVRKEGGVLSREEMRDALWPDTEIELDQSINFCIRQVRAALGDSASAPRFIETLPRRGYRLLVPVTWVNEDDRTAPSDDEAQAPTQRGPRFWMALGAALVLAAALAMALLTALRPAVEEVRIAVMPFSLQPEENGVSADTGRISEWVTAELTNRTRGRAAVFGPRSTEPFHRRGDDLRTVLSELQVDYLVNSRFIIDQGRPGLLIELVRGTDGAHIWVEFFTDLDAWQAVGDTITDNVISTLGLAAD